jgi:hypothetical protein
MPPSITTWLKTFSPVITSNPLRKLFPPFEAYDDPVIAILSFGERAMFYWGKVFKRLGSFHSLRAYDWTLMSQSLRLEPEFYDSYTDLESRRFASLIGQMQVMSSKWASLKQIWGLWYVLALVSNTYMLPSLTPAKIKSPLWLYEHVKTASFNPFWFLVLMTSF